mgnify:CR=1 FL=1|tara:strand:+ start:1555 stop:3030 length:1476 start_codon:yes stop_codon:yes gene_type:complete
MDDEEARKMAESMGVRLMTLDAALTELEALHDAIIGGTAKPSHLRAAVRNAPLISALAMCEGVDELLDEIRDVRGYGGTTDVLRLAISRARAKNAPLGDSAVWGELSLKVKADGTVTGPESSLMNAEVVFRLDPYWKGRIKLDTFAQDILVDGNNITDVDEVDAAIWLDRAYKIQVPVTIARQAMQSVARMQQAHPVQEYLQSLEWDSEQRIDRWLCQYCFAPDKTIVRAYSRRWLISAVARVMRPGCKVDTTLIIQGDQGVKKSTAFEVLASPSWFSDTQLNLRDKDAMQTIRGVWIYEFAELDSVRRTDQTAVKAFLSSRVDRFRPSYGRNVVRYERQCVIVGTTNELDFLRDSTGSRRYWPVQVGTVDIEGLTLVRDQLWAEAVAAYMAGEQWWLTHEEEERRKRSEYLFVEEDAWTEAVALWLRSCGEVRVTTHELWVGAMQKRPGDLTQMHRKRLVKVLEVLGCSKRRGSGGLIFDIPDDILREQA